MNNSKEIKPKGRPKKNEDPHEFNKTPFCDQLNKLYGGRNESQETVANALGTSRQSFGNWLSGRTQPDFETLVKISKYYNVSTDYLLGLTGTPTTKEDDKTAIQVTGLSDKALENIKFLCGKTSKTNYLPHKTVMFLLESKYLIELAKYLGGTEKYYDILEPNAELGLELFRNNSN